VNTPTSTEATPTTSEAMPSLDDRIASVNEALDAASSESAGELGEAPSPASPQVPPAVSGDAAAQQRALERRARLQAMQANERQQVDRKAQQTAQERMARDLEAAQRRADDAERTAAARVDLSSLDEAAFFELAEKRGIQPDRLGQWINEAMTNPEKRAQAAALQAQKTTYDPKLAALEAKIAEQQARIDAFTEAQDAERAKAQEAHDTRQWLGWVAQSGERAPLAAKLLQQSEKEFLEIATVAAPSVAGLGPEALLDAVEEMLDGPAREVAQTWATIYGITSQQPALNQPTTRGAAKPTTVSNSLAQDRASLVEGDEDWRLPLEERAARAIRAMK
jgi:hypothetical protein